MSRKEKGYPEIKICGLTEQEEAMECARLGADAIGLVFFEKSPRNVSIAQARQISLSLPEGCVGAGVFVNASFSFIMERASGCNLSAVQLHGNESPELVRQLRGEGLTVIKALYLDDAPSIETAHGFSAHAFLVECGKGVLPGGNALSWDWGKARRFGEEHPLVIAGGLSPDNIAEAIRKALPAAVDISSGVESAPGRKDLSKVATFIENTRSGAQVRRIGLFTRPPSPNHP